MPAESAPGSLASRRPSWSSTTTEHNGHVPATTIAHTIADRPLGIREDAAIYDPHGEMHLPASALANGLVQSHPFLSGTAQDTLPRVPGPMWLKGGLRHPDGLFHIVSHDQKIEFDHVVVSGRFRAVAHSINLAFGEGDMIDDAVNGESRFREMSSLPFKIQEILREQEGVDLTPEEYVLSKLSAIIIPLEATAENAQMKISFSFKPESREQAGRKGE